MKVRTVLIYVLYLAAAAIGFAVVVWMCAIICRPDTTILPVSYNDIEMQHIEQNRQTVIDPDNPVVLYREVNYQEGSDAPWYPRGESPVLTRLVNEGQLPPVAERVSQEPVVVEGVDGIGSYGGTWYRLSTQISIPGEVVSRLSYVSLVRWSPQGYPIVPHLAKGFDVSSDNREFIFHLRKGVCWSDGHPFSADDIMFWWHHIANEKTLMTDVPSLMKAQGQPGDIEKIDDYTIRISFPVANGIFLARLASDGTSGGGIGNCNMLGYPAHYLRKFHPVVGDEQLIQRMVTKGRFQSKETFFRNLIGDVQRYPDYPRLWPWVYRTYKSSPPYSFVRNPYYWMVDTQGNQLPYIDRIVFDHKTEQMIPIAAAGGDVTMQHRFIPFEEYTYLMSERTNGDYDVYHWYSGDRGLFLIACNVNLRIDPARPATTKKRKLLGDTRFRKALSLAIDRESIIEAEYSGFTTPAQCAPGPASYFYDPDLYHAYVEYDPQRANELLDDIGLTQRDFEGYRNFHDGSRMVFYLNVASSFGSPGIMQLVVDDWAEVGLRVIPRIRNRGLFYTEKMGLQHDLTVWSGNSEFLPIISPRYFVPISSECNFAIGYASWYQKGGLYGDPDATSKGCIEPSINSPYRRVMQLYEHMCGYARRADQKNIFNEILKINAENLWTINVSTPPPSLVIVKNGLRNVPRNAVSCWEFKSPGNAGIETYFFEKPHNTEDANRDIVDSIADVTMPPQFEHASQMIAPRDSSSGRLIGILIHILIVCMVLSAIVLLCIRHPYVIQRLVIMIPTLLIVSIIVFCIIQAPPGDYLASKIMMLEERGSSVSRQELAELREMFWLDDPLHVRYAKWLGLQWFLTFQPKDAGLLQGNLGRSMRDGRVVNEIVGDRIVLTTLISLGSILFTWTLAIPIGIYSAVRQYSIGDYICTFIGFIGMCIPSFLLALVLMYWAKAAFGITVSGLFSSQYGTQPDWSWGKVIDLMKHIWLPVIVLGVGGTAGMIRVMRGNLLDELRKPYVTTARAKGVRPMKLLFKYPVRMALNPFVSGIGGLFPQLISGGAIVAVVLSLPTVGPLMLDALLTEDMYLAGSMLMVISLLGVLGILVSDLLLLWLDPRIRFKAGTR